MKEFLWRGYTVQITKKQIKRTNLRIKPSEPQIIHISIPCQMSYQAALAVLEQPKILKWVEHSQEKLYQLPESAAVQKEKMLENIPAYQERLKKVLPAMFRKWEAALGVKSNKVSIRDTRSQWGSCNPKNGNISISVWLGAFPDECIEYVVVHELSHMLERGHNQKFYGILDHHYPKWRQCRDRLKSGNASFSPNSS